MVSFGRLGRKTLRLIDWHIIELESLVFVLALRVRRTEGLKELRTGAGLPLSIVFYRVLLGLRMRKAQKRRTRTGLL